MACQMCKLEAAGNQLCCAHYLSTIIYNWIWLFLPFGVMCCWGPNEVFGTGHFDLGVAQDGPLDGSIWGAGVCPPIDMGGSWNFDKMGRVAIVGRGCCKIVGPLLSVARRDPGFDGCCDWRGMGFVIVDGFIGFEQLSGPLESPLLGKFDFRFWSPESMKQNVMKF